MRKMYYLLCLPLLLTSPRILEAQYSQYTHIKITLSIRDNQNRKATVYFGVDSYATDCIDSNMGEFELPADQCDGAPLCAYLTSPPTDTTRCLGTGVLLDLRAFHNQGQVNKYLVVFRTQDYPVTVSWPKYLYVNYDSIKISDVITGSIVRAYMSSPESLAISNTSIQQLLITASGPNGILDGVRDRRALPQATGLSQNYPNPFNPTTRIDYTLAHHAYVTLRIYTITGQVVATLVDGEQPPGQYQSTWHPDHVPSGMYYYRLTTSDGAFTRPMIYLR